MSKKVRLFLIIVIVLFISGMALYPTLKDYFSQGETSNESPQKTLTTGGRVQSSILNVNAMVIKYSDLQDIVRITGLLLPDEEVDLSFESSGMITDIYFKEGTNVRKGQLLAKINDKPLQAELKKLETQLPLARDRVFRQKSLLAKDAVSQEAYESVNTELEKLKADIELVKTRIAQTELRAPFDGVIGLRLISEGAYASPSTVVSRLTKLEPLKVEFSIPEANANNVLNGKTIYFTVRGNENKHKAVIYASESRLDEQTLSLVARALYPNKGGLLKPGQAASIEIVVDDIKNAIIIPSLSTVAEMGRDIAYVYKDGRAHQVVLQKGIRTASDIQIIEGLNIGDTLLVSGVMQLRDGIPVVIDQFIERNE